MRFYSSYFRMFKRRGPGASGSRRLFFPSHQSSIGKSWIPERDGIDVAYGWRLYSASDAAVPTWKPDFR
jgi:hypothetical protein